MTDVVSSNEMSLVEVFGLRTGGGEWRQGIVGPKGALWFERNLSIASWQRSSTGFDRSVSSRHQAHYEIPGNPSKDEGGPA